jgi:hypothetical protein
MQNKPNFLGVLMNANGFSQGDYENETAFRLEENKANQTQFQNPRSDPDRIWSLSSSENAYKANGSTCKKLDI